MRMSHFYHLYQLHFARRCDALSTWFDAKARKLGFVRVVILCALLGPGLLIGMVAGFHFLGFAFGAPILILSVLGVAVMIGDGTYDYTYGSALDDRRVKHISKLLAKQGPMHLAMLLNQYLRVSHDYMEEKDLRLLLTAYKHRHMFVVSDSIVALPGQSMLESVPVPVDNDYVVGYHTLYRRLAAIRANPELATVPDGLIDDMYGRA